MFLESEGHSVNLFTSNSMLMMERSMDFLWIKQTAILDNIANIETPNYKTKYVTFEEALQQKLSSVNSSASRVRDAIEGTNAVIHESDESTKADGNGVDINEQSVELARNAFQQQHVFNALNTELSLLRAAIQG